MDTGTGPGWIRLSREVCGSGPYIMPGAVIYLNSELLFLSGMTSQGRKRLFRARTTTVNGDALNGIFPAQSR